MFPWATTEGPPAQDTPERRSLQACPPPAPPAAQKQTGTPVSRRWGPDGVPELQTGPGGLGSPFSPALPESCRKSRFFCKIVWFSSPSLHLGRPALSSAVTCGRRLSLPPWCRWQACPPRPTPGPFGGTRHPRMDSITSSRNYLLLCLLLSSFCRTLGCCSLRSPYPCLGVWGCRGQQGGCGVVTGNRAGTVASRLPSSMTGDPRASEGGREVSPGAQMAQEARMPSSLEMPPGLWE